jgi:hypothetical protein
VPAVVGWHTKQPWLTFKYANPVDVTNSPIVKIEIMLNKSFFIVTSICFDSLYVTLIKPLLVIRP